MKEEKKEGAKPKMRITLLDKKLRPLSDRLVNQLIEFTNGPVSNHTGPVRLEFTLMHTDDKEMLIKYLSQLEGKIPLKERKVYKSKKSEVELAPIEELWRDINKLLIADKYKTQEDLIKYLREKNFIFLTRQALKDKKIPIEILQKEHQELDFLIRRTREGKTPKADKFDPQLAIGIKLRGERRDKFVYYMYGKLGEEINMPWPKKTTINFKKIKPTVFPHYMSLEEREKYRMEEFKMRKDPNYKPNKLYLRWHRDVHKLNKPKDKK